MHAIFTFSCGYIRAADFPKQDGWQIIVDLYLLIRLIP